MLGSPMNGINGYRHTENRTKLALTEEMDCTRFISWLKANLPR